MADKGQRRRRAIAAGVPATLLLAFANPTQAMALQHDDYPSWDDVEQARHNEAAASAKVDEIEGILVRLEADAADLNRTAQERGEDYALAATALDTASVKVDRLKTQADAAQKRAHESEQRVAVLVAQLARSGGGDVTLGLLLGSTTDTDSLLTKLGIADRLTVTSAALLDRAVYDKKTADALATDARVAQRERERLAGEAQTALDSAQAAATDAQAKADAQRADIDRMYAQLATLKGTSAALEREYYEGISTPPTNPPPSPSPSDTSSPSPSPSPSTPTPPTPPTPSSSAVEMAISYATAQLGERYVLGGMGPNVWDCSGLTKASYAAAGVYIGTHSSTDQYNYMAAQGRLVPISQMQRGDLLYYSDGGSASVARKYHVTIYLGGGKMIEAPNPTTVVRIVNVRYGDLVPYAGRPTG
ncbi:MAG: C40 family peptidase [Pseudolysinimonas sp.]|uniref:C40 family peptidase n=1 Tax=Pseudolysinimonas sp. TaxID=2680009 RepID=UPI0032654422